MPSNNNIYKMSNAGGFKSLNRYYDMLAGNAAYVPIFGAYDSIATTTLGSAQTTITFSSIPSTYTHLQIRGIARATGSFTNADGLIRFNSDTGANYAHHALYGDGANVTTTAGTSTTSGRFARNAQIANNNTASCFSAFVVDILDYANASKYKTVRTLVGYDANGSGISELESSLWQSTSAVTQIDLTTDGGNFAQYSSFALYGIKGA
jgi:hypothetical protein